MQTTEDILEDAKALTGAAYTLWKEGHITSEIIVLLLSAKKSIDDALKNLRAHAGD